MNRLLRILLLSALCPALAQAADDIVIADFEGADYAGWIATGEAFGKGPAQGTLANQQPVEGFLGHGLANTYLGGDGPQGTLTSPPFKVERAYLKFLIGGGNHPGTECINLIVGGKVVRSATGGDDEFLDWATWDVRPFKGESAHVTIADLESGQWGHINVDQIVQTEQPATATTAESLYHERYRPQFHFSPPKNWMNDPNGLVWFDGEYHLFFQHDPSSIKQTPVMSWGHSVSPDLVHWSVLPIALEPDERGWVWSGSAVVDWHNTAGFQTGAQPAMVAMYTAAKKPFSQCIAFSNDRGRTWTRYAKNPVIGHIAHGNRDPHMIWYEPGKKWVVVFFKDENNEFILESSTDLKQWTQLQEFRVEGCNECPDFFPMPLDGDATHTKWVFTAANGHYVVGSFDGEQFKPEQEPRQVDFGRNYYAVQTYSDIPASDGRRLQIAWMAGGRYPHMPFNQQMSFPAELTLHATPDGPRLFRYPAKEIESLHGADHHWAHLAIKPDAPPLAGVEGGLFDIQAVIDPGDSKEVGLEINGVRVTYDVGKGELSSLGTAKVDVIDGHLKLRILADRTSIETFANGGRVSLTSCYLPDPTKPGVRPFCRNGAAKFTSLTVYEMKSAWPEAGANHP